MIWEIPGIGSGILTKSQINEWVSGDVAPIINEDGNDDNRTDDIIGLVKEGFRRYTDEKNENHFGEVRKLSLPSRFGKVSFQYRLVVSDRVVQYLHKFASRIEQHGWVVSIRRENDQYMATFNMRPLASEIGVVYYPTPTPDDVFENGLVLDKTVLLARSPAAARLIAIRNLQNGTWSKSNIGIVAIDASSTNALFYPHPEYPNCVVGIGEISADRMSLADNETLEVR